MNSTSDPAAVAAVVFACIGFYFLPLIIAQVRGHANSLAIFMLNLLLGWTLLGWIIALVWSCTNNTKKSRAAA